MERSCSLCEWGSVGEFRLDPYGGGIPFRSIKCHLNPQTLELKELYELSRGKVVADITLLDSIWSRHWCSRFKKRRDQ